MKNLLFIFFVFNFLFLSAQTKIKGNTNSTVQNMITNLPHDTCLNKKFSIVFYVVLDSLPPPVGPTPGNATPTNLNNLVNDLNDKFKNICVQFLNCSTVYIPHHPYNQWSKNIVDPIVTSNWYTAKTINVYLVDQITGGPNNEMDGYAYPPPPTATTSAKDVIVLTKTSLGAMSTTSLQNHVALHHFGHFFGLLNTFDEKTLPVPGPPSQELFNRTNCYTSGDGFCDTEADPYPLITPPSPTPPNSPIYTKCGYYQQVGTTDANGQYHIPPVDNIMSNWGCRCKFSQEQYNYMAYIILTRRIYLH